MKSKTLTVLIAFLAISAASFAQKTSGPFFQLGIKGGANITKVDGMSFKQEFLWGYHLGGLAQVRIGDKWQIQPEVLFNQLNTRTDSNFRALNPFAANGSNLKNVQLN